MKTKLATFLKWFLLAGGAVVVVLLVFGIVLALNWPWWVALCIMLLLAGGGAGIALLRNLWLRKREQNFVQEVIAQDKGLLKSLSGKEREHLAQLQERWKDAVGTLKNSHLKKHGNPLYVLPWYLVIGESGSGKTTSLNSARLSSSFIDVCRTSGVSGTRNCDWWFFEESIVIDTAGRYAVPVDSEKDRDEWQKFLSLLVKYRKKEPLNGLIVTVAADRLLAAGHEENAEEGRTMRSRIDELMRALGVRFPVYVLVTKCDLVEGMNRFAGLLPEAALKQPMGMVNQELSTDVASFTGKAVSAVVERLRTLRLLLLHQPEARNAEPGLVLFPEEFAALRDSLAAFMEGAFRENPYQETPILRGLFFSSGRQEGSPHSRFSEALGLAGESETLPGTSKGLFLHDFFARILPADRALLAPTRRAVEWRALTGNLGLVSWMLLGVALCGILSFSFVRNMTTIRQVARQFERTPRFSGNPTNDLLVLDSFRQGILKVEERNRSWWIPRLGLTESIMVERTLKEKFCRQFRDGFLTSYDRQLAAGVAGLSAGTPDELFAQYAIHLARRINILNAGINGKKLPELSAMPQPASVSFLAGETAAGADARKRFGTLYLHYLAWRGDSPDLARETAQLQGGLRQIIGLKGGSLTWLAPWIDRQSGLPAVTLAEFWGGGVPLPEEPAVPASFTRKGKAELESLVAELETALGDARSVAAGKGGLGTWYRGSCLAAWQRLAADFPSGADRLRTIRDWQQVAVKMATEQGPYFAFINRMSSELEALVGKEGTPPFVSQLYAFQVARAGGAVPGAVGKAAESGKRFFDSLGGKLHPDAVAKGIDTPLAAPRAWQEYQAALSAIAPAASSRQQAFQLATQAFTDDPVTGKTPFVAAWGAAGRLRSGVAGSGADDAFWRLVTGPLDYLWSYVRREAGCQLQTLWEEQVIAATLGMPPQQAGPMLLGPDGLAWRFVKGPAAPFIRGTASGYAPRQALGGALPIEGSLFAFLSKGAQVQASAAGRQPNYTVAVKGLPTDANSDARIRPHATRLELQCAGAPQTLVNQNFPVGKTFYWSPETCGDVIFQIEVGDLVLTRRYGGSQAFPDFLREFAGGSRTFPIRDFPGEKDALLRMGLKYIRVNYQIIGGAQVVKQGSAMAGATAPRVIARCW